VFKDHNISVESEGGAEHPGCIIPGVIYHSVRGSQDGSPGSVIKLHTVVRFTPPSFGAAEGIAGVYRVDSRGQDGGLEDEISLLDAIVHCRRVAGDGSGG
jgi:hypothetical protein